MNKHVMTIFLALASLQGQVAAQVANAGSGTPSIEIPDRVREALMVAAGHRPSRRQLDSITLEVDGTAGKAASVMSFTNLESGLLGVTTHLDRAGASGIAHTISLRGLFDLVSTLNVEGTTATTVIPLGKQFLPFALSRPLKAGVVTTVSELEGDLETLLSPSVGALFKVRRAWTRELTTSGAFGTTRTIQARSSMNCTVGEERPGATLHPDLNEPVLPVMCIEVDARGAVTRTQLVHLTQSNVYIKQSILGSGVNETYKILRLDYVRTQ